MDPTKFKRAWPDRKTAVKSKWSRLNEEEIEAIDGRLELLVGKLRDRYEWTEAEASRQVDEFMSSDTRRKGDMSSS